MLRLTTIVLLACVGSASGEKPILLRAGADTIDITPPTGHAMWGYAARHDDPSVKVRDPLHARAVVFEVDQTRIALVALDLGRAPTRQSFERIQKGIAPAKINEVFLVASHTHHGPVIELDDWPTPEKSYVRALEEKLIQVILRAARHLKPAQIAVGAEEVMWNRNRQSQLPDKPVDRTLTLIRVEDEDGQPIAHLVNFAAHPTMLPVKMYHFSADYPGALCAEVESQTSVPCLFLQGAAGDLSVNPPPESRSSDSFGKLLGKKILKLNKKIKVTPTTTPSLHARSERLTFAPRIGLDNVFLKSTLQRAFFPEIILFYEREYQNGVQPLVTTALLNDTIGFVGVSGELFCGHALHLRKRARLPHLIVLGYCNDYHQYFPTIEAAAEGGYGADPPIAMAEIGAGERLMDRALIHLYQMRDKLIDVPPDQ